MENQNLFEAIIEVCNFIPRESDMQTIIDAYERDKAQRPKEFSKPQISTKSYLLEYNDLYFKFLNYHENAIKKGDVQAQMHMKQMYTNASNRAKELDAMCNSEGNTYRAPKVKGKNKVTKQIMSTIE